MMQDQNHERGYVAQTMGVSINAPPNPSSIALVIGHSLVSRLRQFIYHDRNECKIQFRITSPYYCVYVQCTYQAQLFNIFTVMSNFDFSSTTKDSVKYIPYTHETKYLQQMCGGKFPLILMTEWQRTITDSRQKRHFPLK